MNILKQLQVFILCFSLWHVQIGVAYAQNESPSGSSSESPALPSIGEQHKKFSGDDSGNGKVKNIVGDDGTDRTATNKPTPQNRTATVGAQMEKGPQVTADLLTMITMLAMGLIAGGLIKAKKKSTDMMIAIAAGVAYIAAEIMAIFQHKNIDVEKQVTATLSSNGPDHEQIASLEKQKQDYLNMAKHANQKKMFHYAAAAGFGVAAGIAFFQKGTEETVKQAEKTTEATVVAALEACAATAPTNPVTAQACIACDAALKAKEAQEIQLKKYEELPDEEGSSVALAGLKAALETKTASVKAACTAAPPAEPVIAAEEASKTVTEADAAAATETGEIDDVTAPSAMRIQDILDNNFERSNIVFHPPIELQKFSDDEVDAYIAARDYRRAMDGEISSINLGEYDNFRKALKPSQRDNTESLGEIFTHALNSGFDLLMPKAQAASMMSMIGLGGAALLAFMGAKKGTFKFVDELLLKSNKRAIVWLAFAAMATTTAILNGNIAKKMKENADKIDGLIKRMRTLENSKLVNDLTKKVPIYDVGTFPITGNKTLDLTGGNKNVKLPCAGGHQPPCRSLSAETENAVGQFSNFPPGLAADAKLAAGVADGLQGKGKLSGATLNNAGKLANSLGAINKRNKKLQDALNKLRKQNGDKPIDFAKEAKKVNDALMAQARKSLSTPAGQQLLASYGNGASLPPTQGVGAEEKEMKNPFDAINAGARGSGSVGAFGLGKSGSDGFKWDGSDTSSSGEELLSDGDTETGEYVGDITDDGNASIWQVISTRYMKTGYSRLLDEIP